MQSYLEFLNSEGLGYHLLKNIPINDNVFRYGSTQFFSIIEESRQNSDKIQFTEDELDFLGTDIGSFELFEGKEVPLDLPMLDENTKGVKLNKPKRGGSKKYFVYVRNSNGNIVKVNFGDDTGLSAKINNAKARKSFAARHNCKQKKDKTSPGYWSCRLPRYAKSLGLAGGGNYFW